MINYIKKLFNNRIIKNERGSTLTMAIIVIAVLSFTVTTVTTSTVNLSSSTTANLNTTNDESLGKGLITQAISELEEYVLAGNTYDDFNNNEISRIWNDYSIIVDDVTSLLPDFGDSNGRTTKAYKFSYQLLNDTYLVKYAYLSVEGGSNVDSPHPWSFALATSGDLVLNGGYYEDVDLYGDNVYIGKTSPWYEDDVMFEHYVTPEVNSAYPDFNQGSNDTDIWVTNDYMYCASSCITVNTTGSDPYVLDKSAYTDVSTGGLSEEPILQPETISDFFSGFSLEDYFIEQVTENLPTDSRTITDQLDFSNFADVIRANMDVIEYRNNGRSVRSYPNTAYYDITNDSNYDFNNDNVRLRFGAVYDGDLTISEGSRLNDFDNEGLIVLGDLTIDSNDSDQEIIGTYVVEGNLYFTGNEKGFDDAMFIVLGETYFNMNDYEGVVTQNDNRAFTILSRDNIIISSINETNDNTDFNEFVGFFYSQESIWIDTVNSKFVMKGALYAEAQGNSLNPINMEDELGNQINGIVINSYRGYAVAQYTWIGPNWWDWGYQVAYSPSSQWDNNRFQIEKIAENRFDSSFNNLPELGNVTVTDGNVTIETSEWRYE